MTDALPTGSTIGILGGGQLGRMLSVAASRLGFKTHIFEPSQNPPAAHVADRVTTAPYDDLADEVIREPIGTALPALLATLAATAAEHSG